MPRSFAVDDGAAAVFLAAIVVGDLVTATADGLVATFLPLLYDDTRGEQGALLGHVARANDHWKRAPVADSMVIAHGVDAYVSPGWYASKAEHGKVVPTWDYTTAHVYGELLIHDDPEWVDDVVRRLTVRHEAGRREPWSVDDAPAAFHKRQLRAIVGVELVVRRVEAKFKMSQNRPQADIDGVVAGLTANGASDVAAIVERLRPRASRPEGHPG
jgi:transcriptional regulator